MVTTMLTTVSRSGKTNCWTRVPPTNWPVAARRMSTRKGIVPRPCARRAKISKDGWMCGYPPCGRMESKIPIRSVFLELKPRCPSQRYSDFATGRITPALNCHPPFPQLRFAGLRRERKPVATRFKTNHRRNELAKYFIPLESSGVPFLTRSSAHRFLHERADPCLFGGGQLLQREGGRPHGAFIEVRLVHEAGASARKRARSSIDMGMSIEM